jgi:hypothetical protein
MNVALLRLGALELGTTLLFGVLSFYAGITLFKRFMGVPDLWAGIVRRRNLALAMLLAAFVAGMLVLMSAAASAATELASSLFGERGTAPLGAAGFVLRLGVIWLVSGGGSVLLLMASLWIYDRHTPELHELDSVRRGNVASGMLLSALCISVFLLMAPPFATLFRAIAPPIPNRVLDLREPFLNLPILKLGLAEVALTLAGITLLSHLGLRFMSAVDPRIDEEAAAGDDNQGVACFVAFSFLGFARFLRAGLVACEGVAARLVLGDRPSPQTLLLSGLRALALLVGSILLGVLLTRLGLLLFGRLIRRDDPEGAILRGNLPAALVAGAFVLSLAILMGHGAEVLLTSFTTTPVHLGGGLPLPAHRP